MSLAHCDLPADTTLQVYLTDDGCTDGTAEVAKSIFPEAEITRGDGTLFWGHGMRQSMIKAMENNVDYILWLNDDVSLYPFALIDAFAAVNTCDERTIVIGSTEQEPGSGVVSYGGVNKKSAWRPMKFVLVDPRSDSRCETMNGQFVLLPSAVYKSAGLIDEKFQHSAGDFDYGYRAAKMGIRLTLLPRFIGSCPRGDSVENRVSSKTWLAYWEAIRAPTGMPAQERFEFCRRHAGKQWIIHWLWPYVKLLILFPCFALVRRLKMHKN